MSLGFLLMDFAISPSLNGFEPEWLVLDNPICRVEFVADPWATDQGKKASFLRAQYCVIGIGVSRR